MIFAPLGAAQSTTCRSATALNVGKSYSFTDPNTPHANLDRGRRALSRQARRQTYMLSGYGECGAQTACTDRCAGPSPGRVWLLHSRSAFPDAGLGGLGLLGQHGAPRPRAFAAAMPGRQPSRPRIRHEHTNKWRRRGGPAAPQSIHVCGASSRGRSRPPPRGWLLAACLLSRHAQHVPPNLQRRPLP